LRYLRVFLERLRLRLDCLLPPSAPTAPSVNGVAEPKVGLCLASVGVVGVVGLDGGGEGAGLGVGLGAGEGARFASIFLFFSSKAFIFLFSAFTLFVTVI